MRKKATKTASKWEIATECWLSPWGNETNATTNRFHSFKNPIPHSSRFVSSIFTNTVVVISNDVCYNVHVLLSPFLSMFNVDLLIVVAFFYFSFSIEFLCPIVCLCVENSYIGYNKAATIEPTKWIGMWEDASTTKRENRNRLRRTKTIE